jgi:hypothetical protein
MSVKRYARDTTVGVDRSIAEIDRIVSRYGCGGFQYGREEDLGLEGVMFRRGNVTIKLAIPMPDKGQFRSTPAGRRRRSDADVEKAWEQARRQSWRALALVIKAKLEAVEAGITTFEKEFLPDMLLPSGNTVAAELASDVQQMIHSGKTKRLMLPGL